MPNDDAGLMAMIEGVQAAMAPTMMMHKATAQAEMLAQYVDVMHKCQEMTQRHIAEDGCAATTLQELNQICAYATNKALELTRLRVMTKADDNA